MVKQSVKIFLSFLAKSGDGSLFQSDWVAV